MLKCPGMSKSLFACTCEHKSSVLLDAWWIAFVQMVS